MAVYDWSTTASSNATADSNINWAEGQSPSTVNNSARAMMAAVKSAWLDLCGGVAVGGTANALTLTPTQALPSLTNAIVGFFATADNTGAATLAVSGLTAKPLRYVSGEDLTAAQIQNGGFYIAAYNTADAEWIIVNSEVSKDYVTAALASYLPLTGGTLTGNLTLAGAPSTGLHAATKTYVDTADALLLPLAGGTLTGALTLSGAPTNSLHASTKAYVDSTAAAVLPSQTGKSEFLLTTDGSTQSWSGNSSVRARATITVSGTTPSIQTGSVNVGSVSRVAAGTYDVSFTSNLASANYQVSPNVHQSALAGSVVINAYNYAQNGFRVTCGVPGSGNIDPTFFNFTVHGGF